MVTVQLKDSAGNYGYASKDITLDFEPPQLTALAFSPTRARAGTAVTLVLNANEALAGDETTESNAPVLGWRDGLVLTALTPLSRSDFGWVYSVDTPNMIDGAYAIDTVFVEDLVGNQTSIDVFNIMGDDTDFAPTLLIDQQTPSVSTIDLNQTRFSAAPDFNEVELSFEVTEILMPLDTELPNPWVQIEGEDISASCIFVSYETPPTLAFDGGGPFDYGDAGETGLLSTLV